MPKKAHFMRTITSWVVRYLHRVTARGWTGHTRFPGMTVDHLYTSLGTSITQWWQAVRNLMFESSTVVVCKCDNDPRGATVRSFRKKRNSKRKALKCKEKKRYEFLLKMGRKISRCHEELLIRKLRRLLKGRLKKCTKDYWRSWRPGKISCLTE